LSFGLFWFEPNKIYRFEDTLIESVFGDFFGLFRKSSVCFDTSPKDQNKPKKNCWFSKQTEKQPKQIEFWFVLVRTEKKN
jgi:hypothetical protein